MKLVVIGAGTMGRGIARVALAAGLQTTVVDVDAAALARLPEGVERAGDLEAAVAGADAVIEAVPELPELKAEILDRAARAAPALLATNTSTLSITALARGRDLVGMHVFNPVHRMALVEVIRGEATSDAAVDAAVALAETLGKEPVVVRDAPGFVTSRLGLLLGNEAMRMLEEGVASAEDIDKAMRLGYGHPMGPLQLADLVGLDARLNNLRSMHAQSGRDEYAPPAILERLVADGRLGRKTGEGFYRYGEENVTS
jgi:3-hydroxybutyryl-CoA dehydrogenase